MEHLIDIAGSIDDKLEKLNEWIKKEKLAEKHPEMKDLLEEIDNEVKFFWVNVYDEVTLYEDTVSSLVSELEEVIEGCEDWQKEGPDEWIKNSDEFIESLRRETQGWVDAIKEYFRNKAEKTKKYNGKHKPQR
jgi:hypothetical protein